MIKMNNKRFNFLGNLVGSAAKCSQEKTVAKHKQIQYENPLENKMPAISLKWSIMNSTFLLISLIFGLRAAKKQIRTSNIYRSQRKTRWKIQD